MSDTDEVDVAVTYYEAVLAVQQDKGYLDRPLLVEVAAATTHPLHRYFEWNDEIAGHHFRLEQAGRLIRSFRIIREKSDGSKVGARAFYSVQRPDLAQRVYEPSDSVASDPVLTALVRADMKRDILALKRRYAQFEAFVPLIQELLLSA